MALDPTQGEPLGLHLTSSLLCLPQCLPEFLPSRKDPPVAPEFLPFRKDLPAAPMLCVGAFPKSHKHPGLEPMGLALTLGVPCGLLGREMPLWDYPAPTQSSLLLPSACLNIPLSFCLPVLALLHPHCLPMEPS